MICMSLVFQRSISPYGPGVQQVLFKFEDMSEEYKRYHMKCGMDLDDFKCSVCHEFNIVHMGDCVERGMVMCSGQGKHMLCVQCLDSIKLHWGIDLRCCVPAKCPVCTFPVFELRSVQALHGPKYILRKIVSRVAKARRAKVQAYQKRKENAAALYAAQVRKYDNAIEDLESAQVWLKSEFDLQSKPEEHPSTASQDAINTYNDSPLWDVQGLDFDLGMQHAPAGLGMSDV